MKRTAVILAFCWLPIGVSGALGQNAASPDCLYDGKGYSEGAIIAIQGAMIKCDKDKTWLLIDNIASYCIHANNTYSVNSSISINDKSYTCDAKGHWQE